MFYLEFILIVLYVFLIFYLLNSLMSNIYVNNIPSLDFYCALPKDESVSDYSLYNLTVYKMEGNILTENMLMIVIHPQKFHFFIDNSKGYIEIIYHPNITQVSDYHKCRYNDYYDIAYAFLMDNPKRTKIICHRKLDYLKKLYNQKIYFKTYNSLQNPIILIESFMSLYYNLVRLKKLN